MNRAQLFADNVQFGVEGVVPFFEEKEEKGVAKISRFELSDYEARFENIMNRADYLFKLQAGTYCRLHVEGELMMSDTPMERKSNLNFIENANGRVLIAGLGLGMIILNILDKEEVTEVVVIEKYKDVIDLVEPKFTHPKLKVICSDIFFWKPAKGEKFDTIYFDIWGDVSQGNLEEMTELHNKFKSKLNRVNPKSFMDSWMKSYLKRAVRRGYI
jgi:hypothetical protein